MTVGRILIVAVLLGRSTVALAAPLAIANAGFEAPYLGGNLPPQFAGDVPATAFPVGAPPAGWQSYGAVGGNAFVGVLNPGVMASEPLATYFPAGAPEGDNVALTFYDGHAGGAEFGIQQTLAAVLTARTRYTLTVEVGNIASGVSVVQPYAGFGFFDLRGFPGYRIELLAGGELLAADDDMLRPDEGEFLTSTVEAIVGSDHGRLGQSLGVRLVNLNRQDVNDPVIDLEVDFDDVRLDATPLDAADFDADGDVDGDDLTDAWIPAFGVALGADADGDGDSDGGDFLTWQQQFGSGPPPLAVGVPEPASGPMLGAALCCAVVARRGRHSRSLFIGLASRGVVGYD